MTSSLHLVEGGGQSRPAGFGLDLFGEFRHYLAEKVGLPLANPRGQPAASLAEDGHGLGRGGRIGGVEVSGGLLSGSGLLAVVSRRMPVRRGDGQEESHVDEHGCGGAVLAATEGQAAVHEIVGGPA
ncbi:hypothetical protein [Streptomyces coelicoflavus]|uniref:hypothetical protein n=1 Tax=Streptomyces coelicoflavus TaxID=285562 RepID=UPI003629E8C9